MPSLPPHLPEGDPPEGVVLADHKKLKHINTYGELPMYYVDCPFHCRICGREEIWTASKQKWYYEEAKGHIWSVAIKCKACRNSTRL